MARNDLYVRIIGDASSLSKSYRQARNDTDHFNRSITQSARGAVSGSGAFRGLGRSIAFASGTFLGTAGLVATMKASVNAASNLAEQQNKVNVVFGRSASVITDWSKTTATSIGIANDQALEAAGTFGNLFTTVGIGTEKNAELSKSLVELAADLASFNNASPEDALLALRSGLIGEAEPLRRFGVLLTETRVQQEALRETGKKSASQLTAQEKLLARYNIILKDTSVAQGDFARTADGQANSQRILTAEIRDTEAALGTALLPSVHKVTIALRDWLGDTENQRKLQKDVNVILKDTTTLLKLVADGFKLAAEGASLYDQFLKKLKGDGGPVNTALRVLFEPGFGLRKTLEMIEKARGAQPAFTGPGSAGVFPGLFPGVPRSGGGGGGAGGGGAGTPGPLGFNARMAKLQLALAKAELTQTQKDDRAILQQQAALIRERLTKVKSLKDRTALYQDLGRVEQQIAQIDEDAQRKQDEARKKELEQRRKAAEKAREHAQKVKEQLEKQRQALADAVESTRSAIGALFQGPFLNPSDDSIRRTLGVPGPSAKDLTRDVRAQTAQFVAFNKDLARLSRRGAPAELLRELRAGGIEGAPNVHALATADRATLRDLFRAFAQREKVVQRIAHAEVHAKSVTVVANNLRFSRTTPVTQRRGRNAGVLTAADLAGAGSPWTH